MKKKKNFIYFKTISSFKIKKYFINFKYLVVLFIFISLPIGYRNILKNVNNIQFKSLEQLQCKLLKMGCQMPFCNPEQCFGTLEHFFCSNGRYQNGLPF